MSAMASQITSLTIVYSSFILAQIKENIKATRHWPLWGEFTDDRHKGPVTRKMFPFDDVIMRPRSLSATIVFFAIKAPIH